MMDSYLPFHKARPVPTPKINLLINIVLLIKLHFKGYPCLKYIHVHALGLKKPPSGKKMVLFILENGERLPMENHIILKSNSLLG
jgi:hypothetical protein